MKKIKKKMTEQQKEEWFDAAYDGDIETIQRMIAEGVNVKTKNKGKATALHYACTYGHIDIAKILIDGGANVNTKNANLRNPLHLVCIYGDTEMIKLLIDSGADITVKDNDSDTPLDRLKLNHPQQYEELMQWLTEEYPEKMLELMAHENIQSNGIGL